MTATAIQSSVAFTIPGAAAGKGRARAGMIAGRARLYTPPETIAAETRVRDAWHHAGQPWMGHGPLSVALLVVDERPKTHLLSGGRLSAAGRAMPRPARKPDADNQIKLVLDALNGCLYRDDAQVVDLALSKQWGPRALVRINVAQAGVDGPAELDVAA